MESYMSNTPEVPVQLLEVMEELFKNWEPIINISIIPCFIEQEYFNQWYIKVKIKDFSFNFPWNEEITVNAVNSHYGYVFRSMCYSINSAINYGVDVGSEIYKKSYIESLTALVDNKAKNHINEFRNKK